MSQLADPLGRVRCPVCGTDYEDGLISCPKCGGMSIKKREQELVRKEGEPIKLGGVRPAVPAQGPPPPPVGPGYAQQPYPQQVVPTYVQPVAPAYQNPYAYQPRPIMAQSPGMTGLMIAGILCGMGAFFIGIMGTVLFSFMCGIVGVILAVVAIVIGGFMLSKGQRQGIAVIVFGVMSLFMTIMMSVLFYWIWYG